MLSNVSIWQLLIVLVIVIAIFGTKRLKTLGSDLGGAVKGFRSAMNEADKETTEQIGDQSEDASFDSRENRGAGANSMWKVYEIAFAEALSSSKVRQAVVARSAVMVPRQYS